MEKRGRRIVLGLIIGMMILQAAALASAAMSDIANNFPGGSILGPITKFVMGESAYGMPGQQLLIWFVLLVILFVAFSDILSTFSSFSQSTSYIIGLGLTIIFSATDTIAKVSLWLFELVAGFGAIAVVLMVGAGFFAAVVTDLGIKGFGEWIARRKMMRDVSKGEVQAEAGFKVLREMGKAAAKP